MTMWEYLPCERVQSEQKKGNRKRSEELKNFGYSSGRVAGHRIEVVEAFKETSQIILF